jgi:predicted ArsR family transcriptional regulator
MNESAILKALAAKPGSIASELGTTSVEMNKLFKAEKVVKVGQRKTGTKGRPPIEWAITGQDIELLALNHNGFTASGAPKLPDASHIKELASGEEPRMLEFIEKVFAGDYGPREKEDFTVLQNRYRDIVRHIERRNALKG